MATIIGTIRTQLSNFHPIEAMKQLPLGKISTVAFFILLEEALYRNIAIKNETTGEVDTKASRAVAVVLATGLTWLVTKAAAPVLANPKAVFILSNVVAIMAGYFFLQQGIERLCRYIIPDGGQMVGWSNQTMAMSMDPSTQRFLISMGIASGLNFKIAKMAGLILAVPFPKTFICMAIASLVSLVALRYRQRAAQETKVEETILVIDRTKVEYNDDQVEYEDTWQGWQEALAKNADDILMEAQQELSRDKRTKRCLPDESVVEIPQGKYILISDVDTEIFEKFNQVKDVENIFDILLSPLGKWCRISTTHLIAPFTIHFDKETKKIAVINESSDWRIDVGDDPENSSKTILLENLPSMLLKAPIYRGPNQKITFELSQGSGQWKDAFLWGRHLSGSFPLTAMEGLLGCKIKANNPSEILQPVMEHKLDDKGKPHYYCSLESKGGFTIIK
jgi:hypothetical protein